ncbi:MAG: hypothetical protein JWO46_1928 [Nocardioidaceae bacterium]|nr:hypothetical protein [Nocardioidaceae bacterium]
MLDLVGALVCVLVLLATVVVVGLASARVDATTTGDASAAHMLRPGTTSDTGLRDLPLLEPDGPVATAFPGGAGLDDPARVADLARTLAGPLGMADVMDGLLATQVQPIDDLHVLDLYHGYPYAYGELDDWVDYYLDPDAVRSDPGQVVELAGLLVLSGVEDPAEDEAGNTNSHTALAYSLLRRAREIDDTCDVQLQLTFTVAMGFAPHIADLEREVTRSRKLCPDDPTPLWLLGQVQTVQASRDDKFFDYELGQRAMEAAADTTFATLRKEFPRSPLGWAGAADLRLKQAQEGDELGVQRFENRIRRREALTLYEHARTLSDDPALLAGYGWALSGLGRDAEAVAALRSVHDRFPDDPAYLALLVQALQHAGRPKDVVALLEPELLADPTTRTSLRLTPQTYAVREPELLGYGAGDSVAGSSFDTTQKYSAGSTVTDLGFVPAANGVWTGLWCPQANLIGAQIQTGKAGSAYASFADGMRIAPSSCPGFRPDDFLGRVAQVAALSSGDDAQQDDALAALAKDQDGTVAGRSVGWDEQQDFWRSVGDRGHVVAVLKQWRGDLPADPWARHRLGEVDFLHGDYDAAATAYRQAESRFASSAKVSYGDHGLGSAFLDDDVGPSMNHLELGAALEKAGHRDQAATAYLQARDEAAALGYEENLDDVLFYANSQLGGLAMAAGKLPDAVRYLTASLEPGGQPQKIFKPDDDVYLGADLGAQDNNLALALAKQGKFTLALAHAGSAYAHDHANPVYVDTMAFVQQLEGDDKAAVSTYESVLKVDPSAYVSANNLAVLVAQQGHRSQAIGLLEKAVAAAPSYAVGWHNLGVLREPASHSLLASQGALARAARLDRGLRGQDGLQVDTTIYSSGLDVSRPLSPDWKYADTATRNPRALTWGVLALLLLRILWVLGLDKVTGWLSEKVLTASEKKSGRRLTRWFWTRLSGPVAVVASVAVLGWPVLTAAHSMVERSVLVAAVAALVLLPLLVRRLLAREVAVTHFAWVPALVVGAVGVPFGIAFAPYPTLNAAMPAPDAEPSPGETRLRWAVPMAIAPVALVFIAMAALDPVPMVRILALTATALLASVLTPVPPLDGAYLQHRLLGLGVTVLFTFTTVAFALKWI